MPRAGCLPLALLALLASAPLARAQELAPDPYQEHRTQAGRLYKEGRYDEAIEELKAAYAIVAEAKILLNLGHASLRAKRPEEALRYYGRYEERAAGLKSEEKDELVQYKARAQSAIEAAREAAREPPPTGWLPSGQPAQVVIFQQEAPRPRPVPVHKRWYLWAGVALVVAGGVAGIVGGVLTQPPPPPEQIFSPPFTMVGSAQ